MNTLFGALMFYLCVFSYTLHAACFRKGRLYSTNILFVRCGIWIKFRIISTLEFFFYLQWWLATVLFNSTFIFVVIKKRLKIERWQSNLNSKILLTGIYFIFVILFYDNFHINKAWVRDRKTAVKKVVDPLLRLDISIIFT